VTAESHEVEMPQAGPANFTIDVPPPRVRRSRRPMRFMMMVVRVAVLAWAPATAVVAQTTPPPTREAPNPTGRTIIPEKKEQGLPKGDANSTTSKPTDGTAGARPSGEAPAPQRGGTAKEK
jgi:hypothetical protein